MKIVIDFIDSEININDNLVTSLEIENKDYFYRLVSNFNTIANGEVTEQISFYNEKFEEVNCYNKIDILFDYFNIDFNSKKITTKLSNIIINNFNEKAGLSISNAYNKIFAEITKQLQEIDIDLYLEDEFKLENIIKLYKIRIQSKETIIENILLLIDIEKVLNINELIVFINLKQYLSREEISEVYKYAIYNNINILLIDSQSYGVNLNNEKKIIIDNELEEFVL